MTPCQFSIWYVCTVCESDNDDEDDNEDDEDDVGAPITFLQCFFFYAFPLSPDHVNASDSLCSGRSFIHSF